jgi:hypothetical protein
VKKVNKNSPASRENSPALLCIFSGQTAPSPRHYTRNALITKIGFRTHENGGVGHIKTQKKKPNFGGNTHVTLNPKP